VRDARGSHALDGAEPAEAVIREVAAIAIRAGELGFSPARVAVALGVSPRALVSIEAMSTSKFAP
jgi:hypothetical protein